jgi:hypothetical protein
MNGRRRGRGKTSASPRRRHPSCRRDHSPGTAHFRTRPEGSSLALSRGEDDGERERVTNAEDLAAALEPVIARIIRAELRAVGLRPVLPAGPGAWVWNPERDEWVEVLAPAPSATPAPHESL